jgi:hypothetical protein
MLVPVPGRNEDLQLYDLLLTNLNIKPCLERVQTQTKCISCLNAVRFLGRCSGFSERGGEGQFHGSNGAFLFINFFSVFTSIKFYDKGGAV